MTDDLSKINGVGPATVEKLKTVGLTTFAQIAALTDDQVKQLNDQFDLRDGITRDDWRGQAKKFAETPSPAAAQAQDEKPKSGEKLIPVSIKRDIWDDEGTRHRKGTVIELPVEAAMDAVESGAATRVK